MKSWVPPDLFGVEGGQTLLQCAPPSVVRNGPTAQPVVGLSILIGTAAVPPGPTQITLACAETDGEGCANTCCWRAGTLPIPTTTSATNKRKSAPNASSRLKVGAWCASRGVVAMRATIPCSIRVVVVNSPSY